MEKRKKISPNNIKKYTALIVLLTIFAGLVIISLLFSGEKPIGGDIDKHGCVISAGYHWNETDGMCVREWEKEFCTPESRSAEVCIEIFNPVCGLPIKQSFSNSCFACLNRGVKYYVPGECYE